RGGRPPARHRTGFRRREDYQRRDSRGGNPGVRPIRGSRVFQAVDERKHAGRGSAVDVAKEERGGGTCGRRSFNPKSVKTSVVSGSWSVGDEPRTTNSRTTIKSMEINAQLVKQLRDRTGAGMMECKSALTESKGDIGEAEVVLRKRGIASASKKSARTTKQGVITSYIHPGAQLGVLMEVNCESDFVARTADF